MPICRPVRVVLLYPPATNFPYPLHRTRVKICGLTRPQDAQAAVHLGADALGLVFYPPSPRAITVEQAREMVADLPPFVTVVALFVDEAPDRIRDILARVRVDLLQFHGDEAPETCASFAKPWIKALKVRPGVDLTAEARRYEGSSGLLLDAWHPDVHGGSGEAFDWALLNEDSIPDLVLAGGLHAGNLRQALETVRPYGLDVSSGVESAKGIKDHAKMAAFLQQVREFDYGSQRD